MYTEAEEKHLQEQLDSGETVIRPNGDIGLARLSLRSDVDIVWYGDGTLTIYRYYEKYCSSLFSTNCHVTDIRIVKGNRGVKYLCGYNAESHQVFEIKISLLK